MPEEYDDDGFAPGEGREDYHLEAQYEDRYDFVEHYFDDSNDDDDDNEEQE